MHQRDKNKNPDNQDKLDEFDNAIEEFMNKNFLKAGESNKDRIERKEHSKTTPAFIIESMLMSGHVDVIQQALDEEEEGIDPESEDYQKLLALLRKKYPV